MFRFYAETMQHRPQHHYNNFVPIQSINHQCLSPCFWIQPKIDVLILAFLHHRIIFLECYPGVLPEGGTSPKINHLWLSPWFWIQSQVDVFFDVWGYSFSWNPDHGFGSASFWCPQVADFIRWGLKMTALCSSTKSTTSWPVSVALTLIKFQFHYCSFGNKNSYVLLVARFRGFFLDKPVFFLSDSQIAIHGTSDQ